MACPLTISEDRHPQQDSSLESCHMCDYIGPYKSCGPLPAGDCLVKTYLPSWVSEGARQPKSFSITKTNSYPLRSFQRPEASEITDILSLRRGIALAGNSKTFLHSCSRESCTGRGWTAGGTRVGLITKLPFINGFPGHPGALDTFRKYCKRRYFGDSTDYCFNLLDLVKIFALEIV